MSNWWESRLGRIEEAERRWWALPEEERHATDERGRALFGEHGCGWYALDLEDEPGQCWFTWCNRWDDVATLYLFGDEVRFVTADHRTGYKMIHPEAAEPECRVAEMRARSNW